MPEASTPDAKLAAELIEMAAEDARVREELVRTGELFDGYHPRMEAVHRTNAARLREVFDAHGWPGRALVGEEAEAAAWLVALHAIGEPDTQRRALALLRDAVARGDAPAAHEAYLDDRIRFHEGRPQRYGTTFDWNEDGRLVPWPSIEDPDGVDERRTKLGLAPLAETVERANVRATSEGERPPGDLTARRRTIERWAREVGWRG